MTQNTIATAGQTNINVSILMPVLNAGEFLDVAVGSVLSQLNAGDELVIHDGGSTDGYTDKVIDAYGGDSRVRLLVEPDSGQSDALNKALRRSNNAIVGWLNADDTYLPGAIDWAREKWSECPDLDLAYGGFRVEKDNRILRTQTPGDIDTRRLLRRGCYLFTGSSFFSSSLLRNIGGFPEQFHYAMDYALFLEIAAREPKFRTTLRELAVFRWHGASKSGSVPLEFVREVYSIRRSYLGRARDWPLKLALTAWHLTLIATTPIRHSRAYSRVRRARSI